MNHRICSSLLSVILICGIVCKNISAFSGASLPRQRNFNNRRIRNNNHSSRYGGDSLEYYDDDDENSSTLFKRLFKRKLSHLRQRYKSSSPTIIRRLFRKGKRIYILLFPIFVICTGSAAAHATASSTMILPDSLLGPRNILTATVMLFSLGAIPLSLFGVGNIAKVLLYSAGRCAIQVSLLGSIVLHRMMGVKNPGYVAIWILGVGLLASREAIGRIQYKYPHMERNMYLSVVTGGFIILSLTVGLKLFGDIQPWFNPRTWIPIAGMLFGNTLNASALGASSITKQFAVDSDSVELRLIRGADTREAISPLVEESYRIALMPTINSLAATGIIHIPGMMSGQILAGQSPQQAAVYQILINFLIATNALLTVQLIINSSIQVLVDTRESRIRHGILVPKDRTATMIPSFVSIFSRSNLRKIQHSSVLAKQIHIHPSTLKKRKNISSISGARRRESSTKINSDKNCEIPVLKIKHLEVKRANVKVDLTLCSGDRLAITGPSGCGKSQILRTIVGLEELKGDSFISLSGESLCHSDLPRFRSKVCLVPQNKSTLDGTPNDFYKQSLRYRCRRNQENVCTRTVPSEIAKNWNIGVEAFDQSWSTLSGGELQKAALAIALALEPEVLLLDESTSALDESSSLLVEETLKACNIPMIIVTHSKGQLERFCTDRLDLS